MPIDPWPVHAKLATTTPPKTAAIIQRPFAGGQIRAVTSNNPSNPARSAAIAPNRVDISTAPHDVHVPVSDSASAISHPNVATIPTAGGPAIRIGATPNVGPARQSLRA